MERDLSRHLMTKKYIYGNLAYLLWLNILMSQEWQLFHVQIYIRMVIIG